MSSDLITKREAADLLGVHASTVNRMVSDGRLRPTQIVQGTTRAAMYLFRRADIDRLALKRERVAS